MQKTKIIFPEEIRIRFKNYINNRTGLYFKDYDLKDLDGIIAERMKARGFDTVLAYYTYITASEKREDELRELLNRLTVNHTYFFRNEPQFKVLKEKILPEIIERKIGMRDPGTGNRGSEKPSIRIWSAGCSTGEEPYTIAMVIRDVIADPENWNIHILATDASTEAVEKARKGVYGVNSMRLVDKDHIARYFAERPGAGQDAKYAIRDEIKSMVSLGYFNLMDEDYPQGFDIIFCRNVTIYFELETTVRVMNKFADSLDKDGYLFIGYSETLQFISDKFKMIDWEDAIFYAKSREEARLKRFAKPPAPVPAAIKVDEILENISKAEFRADEKEQAVKKERSESFEELLIQAIKAIHTKNYDKALSLIKDARSAEKDAVEPCYLAAEVYTNQGKFDKAKENLEFALGKDMMFAPAHYLFGAIYMEEGKPEEAKKSYKKALYLEKEFCLANFSLANIYKEKGRINDALREYRNTLNVLSKSKPYDILAYSGGFNVATVSSICKNNIERLKSA